MSLVYDTLTIDAPAIDTTVSERYTDYEHLAHHGIQTWGKVNSHGRRCLVKSLRHDRRDDPFCRMAMHLECELLRGLDHQGVPTVVDFGPVLDMGQSLVLDYPPGPTLSKVLEQPLTMSQRRSIADSLIDTVAYLHSKGVEGGCLHSERIVVNIATCDTTVVDFTRAISRSGIMLGDDLHPHEYEAPEHRDSTPRDSTRSDVYSLACLLYQLDCGKPYSKVIDQCLADDPADRPADALEVKRRISDNVARYKRNRLIACVIGAAIACSILLAALASHPSTAPVINAPAFTDSIAGVPAAK